MYKREEVYAVMRTPLFKATFNYANLLYGISNYAYAVELLDNRAFCEIEAIAGAFPWMGSKLGVDFWRRISLSSKLQELGSYL